MHSKCFHWIWEQGITTQEIKRVKEGQGVGGEEGRKHFQTNPCILKTAHLAFHA